MALNVIASPVREVPFQPTLYYRWGDPEGVLAAGESDRVCFPLQDQAGSVVFQALCLAFKRHHAFGLRPEVLRQMIVASISIAIGQDPGRYRYLWTRSKGNETLWVYERDQDLEDPAYLEGKIGEFVGVLKGAVPSDVVDMLTPHLSTDTEETMAALGVGLMEAAGSYYNYNNYTLCGIPRVVVFGEIDDYRRLLQMVGKMRGLLVEPWQAKVLKKVIDRVPYRYLRRVRIEDLVYEAYWRYHNRLIDYLNGVEKVLRRLIAEIDNIESGSEPDRNFWRSIYNFHDSSGSDQHGGWLLAFTSHWMGFDRIMRYRPGLEDPLDSWNVRVPIGREQTCISQTRIEYTGSGPNFTARLVGGVMTASVQEGAITPGLSWRVERKD
jgi:hypothetical protein